MFHVATSNIVLGKNAHCNQQKPDLNVSQTAETSGAVAAVAAPCISRLAVVDRAVLEATVPAAAWRTRPALTDVVLL